MTDPIVIAGIARTPMGALGGALSSAAAPTLGAAAIAAAVQRSGLGPDAVDEAIMGCVLTAGQGQAPARQAAIAAGLPLGTGATTINKMCGSGMKAAMLAHDLILAGSARVMVAGGMESMSNAPYLLPGARAGLRMGHASLFDHMALDGLEDAYDRGRAMGTFAEDCASAFGFTRKAQDAFALRSLQRAQTAIETGRFADEITAVTARDRKAGITVSMDESPGRARPDRIPTLKPAFRDGGTVTAANSSSISDGAAALVLLRLSDAERRGLVPLAIVSGHSTHSCKPAEFTTAPIGAIESLRAKIGWSLSEVDLFEINEAFAVVPMAAAQTLDIPADKLNIHGGACALGHPIGASGARILVTLLSALRQYDLKRGIAAVCIGGGEATAMAIERIS